MRGWVGMRARGERLGTRTQCGSCGIVWDRTVESERGSCAKTSGARRGRLRAYWVEERGWGCGLEGRAGRAGKWVWVGSAGGRGCARERRVERSGWSGLGGARWSGRARAARENRWEKEKS